MYISVNKEKQVLKLWTEDKEHLESLSLPNLQV